MISARCIGGLAGVLLVMSACSGGGGAEVAGSPVGAGAVAAQAIASDAPGYLAPIDPASPYVRSLCSINIESAFTAEDPLAVIVELLSAVTVEDDEQTDERNRLIAAFAEASDLSDPSVFNAVLEAGDILRARCR
jgi:hypothetical protein